MSKITKWICLIVILIYFNAFWIVDMVNSFGSGIIPWSSIIFIVIQIPLLLIYHYGTKDYFTKKWEKKKPKSRFVDL